MKVLFLDIDGVLNNINVIEEEPKSAEIYFHSVNKKNVGVLKYIIEKTGCKIVLSSTWRGSWNRLHMAMLLNAHFPEFYFDIIGDTPHISGKQRGQEILAWIKIFNLGYIHYRDSLTLSRKKLHSFVVLDDDNDMNSVRKNFIKIDSLTGLTMNDAEKAIKILNGENNDH